MIVRAKDADGNTRCWPCGEIGKLTCSICYSQYYCSARCQKQDWPDHKASCRASHAEGDLIESLNISSPAVARLGKVMPAWLDSAQINVEFAAASAFQLTDPHRPSTLPSTHFLLLLTHYHPNARSAKDSLELARAMLLDRRASVDEPEPESDISIIISEVRSDFEECGWSKDEDAAFRQKGLLDHPAARCLVIVADLDLCPHVKYGRPFYVDLPTATRRKEMEEDWEKGLISNLKQDPTQSEDKLHLNWRARMRSEFIRSISTEPIKSMLYNAPTYPFPNPDHNRIDFERSTPDIILGLSNPLARCVSHCMEDIERHAIVEDPSTRVERETLIRQFLERNFEDHLRHNSIQFTLGLTSTNGYSESRIITLLLEGITLEQLKSSSLAELHAKSFVTMAFFLGGQFEMIVGQNAFRVFGPFDFDVMNDDITGMHAIKKKVTGLPTMEEASLELERLYLLERNRRRATGRMHCAHDLGDLNAVRRLADQTFRSPSFNVIPPFDEAIATPVFKKIGYHVRRGDLIGDDWKDPIKWKKSVISAMRIYATSLRSATETFFSTTPKLVAPYRHFIRNFPHIIEFAAVIQSHEIMEGVDEWLAQGGMMQPDDPLLARDDGMMKTSSKAEKNAKKKAKRLAKKVAGEDTASVSANGLEMLD